MKIDLSLTVEELARVSFAHQLRMEQARNIVRRCLKRHQPALKASTDLQALHQSIAMSKAVHRA